MKSHNIKLLRLAKSVLTDFQALADYSPFDYDLVTLSRRVKEEGDSFLTITLPQFGDDFFTSIEQGHIDSTLFRSFKKRGRIPAFLQGIVSQVFDLETGLLVANPSILAITHIRQLSYMFKKVKIDCTEQRYARALEKYAQEEHIFDEPLSSEDYKKFSDVCRILWDSCFHPSDFFTDVASLAKHGPGGTADGLRNHQKYRFYSDKLVKSKRVKKLIRRRRSPYHDRLEQFFPFFGTYFPISMCHWANYTETPTVTTEQEQPVKVLAVPKTLKTPRIIAMEPTCMQYAQQAMSHYIIKQINAHPLVGGQINFSDQSTNRRLALDSSKSGLYSTLDLSSASDRVPYTLALAMFASNDEMQNALDACRSKKAILPTGEILSLRKFASMGSAVCFPVEAMYFYTICIIGLLEAYSLPVTYENVKRFSKSVFVYGDDIICPSRPTASVIAALQRFYCKVGATKSFWKCNFRESCGMDAYDGIDITPIYIRCTCPNDRRDDAASLISWVETSNQLHLKGYWNTARIMMQRCEFLLGTLPLVGPDSAALGKSSFLPLVSFQRWGRRYHRPEVKAWCPVPIYREDKLTDYPALAKSLRMVENATQHIKPEGDLSPQRMRRQTMKYIWPEVSDPKRLERSARHGAVGLKSRWTAPY